MKRAVAGGGVVRQELRRTSITRVHRASGGGWWCFASQSAPLEDGVGRPRILPDWMRGFPTVILVLEIFENLREFAPGSMRWMHY